MVEVELEVFYLLEALNSCLHLASLFHLGPPKVSNLNRTPLHGLSDRVEGQRVFPCLPAGKT